MPTDDAGNLVFHEGLVPADKARRLVLEQCRIVGTERLLLDQCRNRLLAEDLAALRTQPPFDASAMDGYAVRQSDLSSIPSNLRVIGESSAGHPFKGRVSEGEAVRLFTGAVVPDGADTIIIQEDTEADGNAVTILAPSPAGKFIRKAGLDFLEGEVLLRSGDQLSASRLSLAASMNHPRALVFKQPLIAVMATGNELVNPGNALGEGQIIASNSFGMGALIEAANGTVVDLGIARDTIEDLTEKATHALRLRANVIVTMGGASVGDHDLVRPAFEAMGFRFVFEKIAMRPGKPLLFAVYDNGNQRCLLLGLAGNPVSSLVASSVFLRPVIQILGGENPEAIEPVEAVLATPLTANDEREEYMRAICSRSETGKLEVRVFEKQDSSMLANLVRANCLLIRPRHAPAAEQGDPCKIVML